MFSNKSRNSSAKADKKIVVFGNRIPPEYTGVGYRAIRHGRYLDRNGQLAFLLTTTYPFNDVGIKTVSMSVDSSKSHIKFLNKFKLFQFVAYFYKALSVLGKRTEKFDILHSLTGGAFSSVFVLLGKILNYKSVIEVTLPPPNLNEQSQFNIANYLRKWSWNNADILIGISPYVHSYFNKYKINSEKCYMIPNGVNVSKFKPTSLENKRELRNKYLLSKHDKVLILVGPIIRRKGPDIAIKTLKKLRKYDDNYKLILLGEQEAESLSELFGEDKDFFVEENKKGNILIPGLTDKVEEYLHLSDIFIFPTRKEGLGNAPLEAMACGLPVIANKIEGVTDYYIKNGENGFLITDNDYKGYVKHVRKLMKDSSEYNRISANAEEWIKNNITEKIVHKQYQQVYDKL